MRDEISTAGLPESPPTPRWESLSSRGTKQSENGWWNSAASDVWGVSTNQRRQLFPAVTRTRWHLSLSLCCFVGQLWHTKSSRWGSPGMWTNHPPGPTCACSSPDATFFIQLPRSNCSGSVVKRCCTFPRLTSCLVLTPDIKGPVGMNRLYTSCHYLCLYLFIGWMMSFEHRRTSRWRFTVTHPLFLFAWGVFAYYDLSATHIQCEMPQQPASRVKFGKHLVFQAIASYIRNLQRAIISLYTLHIPQMQQNGCAAVLSLCVCVSGASLWMMDLTLYAKCASHAFPFKLQVAWHIVGV